MRFFTEFIDDGEKTAVEKLNEYIAVSYTHLTLPTIYSV